MNITDSIIWKQLKKNKTIYSLIHNSLGVWISEYKLKDRKKSVKQLGLNTIMEIDGILSDDNVVFYVDFGTLLGLVRDGHLLSWDYDIDFGVHINDDYSWDDLQASLLSIGFSLFKQFTYDGIITEQTYVRDDMFVDFFNHFTEGNCSSYYVYYRKEDYKYDNEYELHARLTKTRKIENSKTITIDNVSFHIPSNAEDYLSDVYGSDWKTPQKQWKLSCYDNITYLPHLGHLTVFDL